MPETQGGDFSYFFITNYGTSQALDDNNWNIEVGVRRSPTDFPVPECSSGLWNMTATDGFISAISRVRYI